VLQDALAGTYGGIAASTGNCCGFSALVVCFSGGKLRRRAAAAASLLRVQPAATSAT